MVSANIPGMCAIYYEKPSGERVKVFQARSEVLAPDLDATTSEPSKDTRLWADAPFVGMAVGQGGYITLEYTADATAVTDSTDHNIIVPVVLESKATGQKTQVVLTKVDFDNSDTAGHTDYQDITLTAAIPTVFGKYQVPTGYNAYLGGSGKIFIDLEDNTA